MKKTIQFLIKHYVTVWLLSTLVLYIFILFTSTEIVRFPPDCSAKGLNVFIEVFKIPLYYFTANIGIYTILLTHRRIDQTQTMLEQSNRRLEQTDKQIEILQQQDERSKKQIEVLQSQEDRNQVIFFENTFFKLLEFYKELVDNLKTRITIGRRDIFASFDNRLKTLLSEKGIIIDEKQYYHELYTHYLKAYFDNVKIIFKHLYDYKNYKVLEYVELFKSQLSYSQISIIYIHNAFDKDFSKYLKPFEDILFNDLPLGGAANVYTKIVNQE